MSDSNPYRSPKVESEQVEVELAVAERSWAVHGVVVIGYATGVFSLIVACLSTVLYYLTVSVLSYYADNLDQPPVDYNDDQFVSLTIIARISTVHSILLMIASTGVVWRKNWGRFMAILVAGLTVLVAFFYLSYSVWVATPSETDVVSLLIFSLILTPFPFQTFYILLQKKYKAEFLGTSSPENEEAE